MDLSTFNSILTGINDYIKNIIEVFSNESKEIEIEHEGKEYKLKSLGKVKEELSLENQKLFEKERYNYEKYKNKFFFFYETPILNNGFEYSYDSKNKKFNLKIPLNGIAKFLEKVIQVDETYNIEIPFDKYNDEFGRKFLYLTEDNELVVSDKPFKIGLDERFNLIEKHVNEFSASGVIYSHDNDSEVYKLVDYNHDTYWSREFKDDEERIDIIYEFRAPQKITSYNMTAFGGENFPKSWFFYGSHDKTEWHNIDVKFNESANDYDTKKYITANNIYFKYYKFTFFKHIDNDDKETIPEQIKYDILMYYLDQKINDENSDFYWETSDHDILVDANMLLEQNLSDDFSLEDGEINQSIIEISSLELFNSNGIVLSPLSYETYLQNEYIDYSKNTQELIKTTESVVFIGEIISLGNDLLTIDQPLGKTEVYSYFEKIEHRINEKSWVIISNPFKDEYLNIEVFVSPTESGMYAEDANKYFRVIRSRDNLYFILHNDIYKRQLGPMYMQVILRRSV